ncbi:MAG TPA: sigma-70 family RNA polymerase sigma factor [Thermomicrobiales bacterium]|nr:sigma-70 family RNA polymerase sigma factor [Thermomicrobiales bacterium]
MDDTHGTAAHAELNTLVDDLFRRQAARIVSTLTRVFGPGYLSLAEDVTQETLIAALRQWPYSGVPDNPSAWLMTVARNRALDAIRRERVQARGYADIATLQAAWDELEQAVDLLDHEPRDDQLRMMFTCCHPALSREARVALTLKTLGGLSVPEIARAFLVKEETIARRLVRARRALRERRVSFAVPAAAELPFRLDSVMDALYLLFNEGYSAHSGGALVRHDLCAEAIRLASLLAEHPVGNVPRVHALLALLLLQASRLPARTDDAGDLLLLEDQDRALWDRRLTRAGLLELARAASGETLSVYHLQAEIAACHSVAPNYPSTDWRRILRCYDDLLALAPSPVVALNRAVALAMVDGPEAGIAALDAIRASPGIASYHLFHATLGELWRRAGDDREAAVHLTRALQIGGTDPERRFLQARLDGLGVEAGRATRDA